jgi:phage I-like protein
MNPLLNREFQMPEDGLYPLVPKGEFPHPTGVLQVIDDAACLAMLNRFQAEMNAPNFAGLLLDYDHFSQDTDKSSEAAGWILNLENRVDGLYGLIRWAGAGEEKVRSGAYRFVSPVWNREECESLGGNRVRPLRLANAALTNDPNMKGIKPLTNRSGDSRKPQDAGEPGGKESTMDYKSELLAMLGLPADATDEQITAAKAAKASELENAFKEHAAMTNRAIAAEKQVKVFETEKLEAEVEKDLDAHQTVIANRAEVKAQLMINREGTLKTLRALKKPEAPAEAPKALKNRDGHVPPTETEAAQRTQERGAYIEELRVKNRLSHAKAHELAASLKPELFK